MSAGRMDRFGWRALAAAWLVLVGAWMLDAVCAPPWWVELSGAPVVLLCAGWLCDVSVHQADAAAGANQFPEEP